MSDDFEDFLHQQFPFQPGADVPDWLLLQEVVAKVEGWKAAGTSPKDVFAEIGDLLAVIYLAANRTKAVPPPEGSYKERFIHQTDAWTEGFLFGALFQQIKKGRQ